MYRGTLICAVGLIVCVVIQIYARFFMDQAPSWTEEASRFFFVYSVSFAAGPALRQRYFVALDLLTARLSANGSRRISLLVNILVFALFLLMAVFAVPLVQMGMDETSPSMGFPMAMAFFSILIMGASLAFYAGLSVWKAFKM